MFLVNEDVCSSPKPLHKVYPVTQGILSIFQIDVLHQRVLEIHLEYSGGKFWSIYMKSHFYVLLKILGSEVGKGIRRWQKSFQDFCGWVDCVWQQLTSEDGVSHWNHTIVHTEIHTRRLHWGDFLYLLLLWYISCMDSSYISIFTETMIIVTSKSLQW